MSVRLLSNSEQHIHDKLAKHPLQMWEWGCFRKANGQRVIRVGLFEDETQALLETHQISLHHIPASPFYIGYCPRGPLPSMDLLEGLKPILKGLGVLALKFEPASWRVIDEEGRLIPSPKALDDGEALDSDRDEAMRRRGLVPGKSQFTRYSFILDLQPSEEELLAACSSKTRYNIRLAGRKGVEILDASTEEGLEVFIQLIQETSDRQGFYAHSPAYYRTMFATLKDAGHMRILHAVHEGDVLTAWILFDWKDRLYYPYGASSSRKRELMSNNLMMWEAIRLGKELGCQSFDMWGCMGPKPDESDPWFGFHRFKKGYNPALCAFVGTWDFVVRPLAWKLFSVADVIRWKLLRLRKRVR